jgi:DNA-binding response OmpR family regulator
MIMSNQRVLVVEDDEAIGRGLVDALESAGYAVLLCTDGESGRETALAADVDLLLLDLMLPRVGGLEILREVRSARPTLPVIILTALGEEDDRVKGLRLGADDYVAKPFSVRELLARAEAVLRRTPGRPVDRPIFDIPGGVADLERGELRFADGRSVALGDREMQLLRYLAGNAGRPISRDEILLHVWQIKPAGVETRTIDMHVARLREKLGDANVIRTIRGKGYLFEIED